MCTAWNLKPVFHNIENLSVSSHSAVPRLSISSSSSSSSTMQNINAHCSSDSITASPVCLFANLPQSSAPAKTRKMQKCLTCWQKDQIVVPKKGHQCKHKSQIVSLSISSSSSSSSVSAPLSQQTKSKKRKEVESA